MADDISIHEQITSLVAEEHELRRRLGAGEISRDEEHERLKDIEVRLDQCWDLLRQRDARRRVPREPRRRRGPPGARGRELRGLTRSAPTVADASSGQASAEPRSHASEDRPEYDVERLATRLRRDMRGTVSTSASDRALYATDASVYRVVPDLVVVPRDVEALAVAVSEAASAGAPVTVRGGGTSMAGNAIGSVVIDTSRHLHQILDLDPVGRTATVEPGVVLTSLLRAARPHGLTFGADPSSASRATLGGMIANNACGAHSVAWGTTSDNLRGLDVVLADGATLTLGVRSARPVAGAPEFADRAGRLTWRCAASRRLTGRWSSAGSGRSPDRSRAIRCTTCWQSPAQMSPGCSVGVRAAWRPRCARQWR